MGMTWHMVYDVYDMWHDMIYGNMLCVVEWHMIYNLVWWWYAIPYMWYNNIIVWLSTFKLYHA